ncbi:MAG: hypothetical protein EP330_11275 [Deltaproteobacteria bacterium]|nr:MAG: hypothetical protein EP330_11275 [Deltaproteobacteria bacterium]
MRSFPLLLLVACSVESKLTAGDGSWQIAEYHLTIRDEATGAVRLDETLTNAGTVRFVTDYDDWGGQWAIVDLPTPRPFYPATIYYAEDAVPTELFPNTRYVLWDTGKDGRLKFAWGSSFSEPEEIPLDPDGDGYRGSSTLSFPYDITANEIWEQQYVLVP